ncbi:sugar phosphate isomerase/epimerase family protein [Pseudomonas sp. NY15349]|uniref:sugar phosphate isomerase/epimerase family protein n=1 Tax=unclassified Pseudomonas TaxID=196821 RepID=UPI001F256BAD|nr:MULTISPECIES: TIM barrel protein [unclassified Pseudomonas]MCE5988675.1 sugar phosphate isomerase/epimerase [Pseudomonas sp. LM20]MCE5993850.1 sugar phosphate isomerase/epimerase [Pseudomonas sp. KCA11]UMY64148.1 sugar phosphate isomerase/epimerase [Pseudomonas sp. LS.1a]
MNNKIQERFNALLSHKVVEHKAAPVLTEALAQRLLERLGQLRLFAHAYPLLTNLTHGRVTPADLLDFAYRHELQGLSLHLLDGEENSLSQMSPEQLQAFASKAKALGLDVHLEISSTLKKDVDQVIAIAKALGVRNIRVYSRYEGTLSRVMDVIETDLHYLAQQADANDLYFDFEQHEELKSSEIAQLLNRLNHPRLHALFDFGNMINACEQPLQALHNLAPHIRQVHLKGVRIVPEQNGFGHYGVLQGSDEDDLPSARMLFELLMLGEATPQVIAFILEQENHYVAPAFRQRLEAADPFIAYREMSETPLPKGYSLERMLADEHRWANNQVAYVRRVLGELRTLAELTLATPSNA